MEIVKISELERTQLSNFIQRRENVLKKVRDKLVCPNERLKKKYLGYCGEWAVAKFLNAPFKPNIVLGDGGKQDLIWNNLKIEVKYSSYPNGDLIIGKKADPVSDSDVFVLTTGTDKEIRIVGFIGRSDMETKKKIKNYGYCDDIVIEQKDLTEFSLKNLERCLK